MMNLFKRKERNPRAWGKNPDDSPYVVGMTIAKLITALQKYPDETEVCMTVCPKKYWNGGGLLGKLAAVEQGGDGQIWLKGRVIDESLECL